jgi:hypothetical protein
MSDKSASEQIDDIIKQYGGWQGDLIKRLRKIIKEASPDIIEEIKWRMQRRPEGLPVWSNNGIVCFIETFKNDSKLVFFKGKKLKDKDKIFNARLNSSVRAIEFHEGDPINEPGIKSLVIQAAKLNNQ